MKSIDHLHYYYQGNQLIGLNDEAAYGAFAGFKDNGAIYSPHSTARPEYEYDHNGNLTSDANKGISNIKYNYLNLPALVEMSQGNRIEYQYAANGTKLRTRVYQNNIQHTVTDYCGNFVYEQGQLSYILFSEGRILVENDNENSGGYTLEYHLKDHLGNTRITFTGAGSVTQVTDYYPFGMAYEAPATNPYLYNGKELQTHLELNWYDYGARFYDAQIGRFPSLDPIADKFHWVSPYNYAENSPIANIDLWGLQAFSVRYFEAPGSITIRAAITDVKSDFSLNFNENDKSASTVNFNKIYRFLRNKLQKYSYNKNTGDVRDAEDNILTSGADRIVKDTQFSRTYTLNSNFELAYEKVNAGITKANFNDKEALLDFGHLSLESEEYDKIEIYTDGQVSVEEIEEALNLMGLETNYLIENLSEPQKNDSNNLEIHFYRIKEDDEIEEDNDKK